MYPEPKTITRITSIGGGPIGGGWAAHFLARGYDVTIYLHDETETPAFMAILPFGLLILGRGKKPLQRHRFSSE